MSTYQHPETLSDWQRFQQARSILSQTTRASNHAWYQEAVELEWQLHIRVDGQGVATWYYQRSKNQWSPGMALNEASLLDPVRMAGTAESIHEAARAQKATAMGVVLHIADEFATAELKPGLNDTDDLASLRDAAVEDPHSILDDSSTPAEHNSWRVLPYPAPGSPVVGTTITISKKYAPFLQAIRDAGELHNFPLIPCALSAPLLTTMGLSGLLPATPGKPFVVILRYPLFTVMEFFDSQAELRLVRTQQHRLPQRATILSHAVVTTNASLEMVDPDVFILSMSPNLDPQVQVELQRSMQRSRVEVIEAPAPAGMASWSSEPVFAVASGAQSGNVASQTFDSLRSERWALQDFLPAAKEISGIYPNRNEMRMLRTFRLARRVMFLGAAVILGVLGLRVYDIVRQAEWSFDTKQATDLKQRVAAMTVENQKIARLDNLLEDRSKAWVSMELLGRMFPEHCGVLVKNYAHTVKLDNSVAKAQRAGLIKEWKISGLARDEAVDLLNQLNTQDGINDQFSKIAKLTGNTAFDPTLGNRSISVNISTKDNTLFKAPSAGEGDEADDSTYTVSFDLTITQRFEATDPMAIILTKAP